MKNIDTYLLNDEAMQRFIVEGYLTLNSDQPREYHDRIYSELEPLEETGPMGHNNLLPCVPDLRTMLNEPRVVGALTSILGPGYYLHFHRHDHVNYPDGAQPLHKDGDNHSHHAVDDLRRYHKTRYAMLLYYPQDTPLEMGPTGIVPRSQYVTRRAVDKLKKLGDRHKSEILQEIRESMDAQAFHGTNRFQRYAEMEEEFIVRCPELIEEIEQASAPWEEAKIPLVGDAGTVTIVHFDLVHGRYAANLVGKQRHMVKFLFSRNIEPTAPSWNHRSADWKDIEQDCQAPVWRNVWSWHLGSEDSTSSTRSVENLSQLLLSPEDDIAIGAAYELGSMGTGLDVLWQQFISDDPEVRSVAAYGIVRAASRALPRLIELLETADPGLQLRVIDVIGDIALEAGSATSTLVSLSNSEDVKVRRATFEALGMVTQTDEVLAPDVVAVLGKGLDDEDAIVVRNTTFAISRLGAKASTDSIIDQIDRNLSHWHHHVRGWSIEALQRLENPRAMELALSYLMSARWDPALKSGDREATAKTMREAP